MSKKQLSRHVDEISHHQLLQPGAKRHDSTSAILGDVESAIFCYYKLPKAWGKFIKLVKEINGNMILIRKGTFSCRWMINNKFVKLIKETDSNIHYIGIITGIWLRKINPFKVSNFQTSFLKKCLLRITIFIISVCFFM